MQAERVKYCLYRLLGFVADVLDDIGATTVGVVPTTRPSSDYGPSDVDHLTEEEIRALPHERPTLSEELGVELGDNHILRLTDDTLDKTVFDGPESSEATALDMVFRHTTMSHAQLKHVWPTMSFFQKLRVGFILRRYIRQLRAIRHPRAAVPGPVAPGFEARVCHSHIFGARRPERAQQDVETTCWKVPPEEAEARHREPFDDSQLLVLTHGDLNMRNILVEDDGRLWLIDWGTSGFYPVWFEYTIMAYQADALDPFLENDAFWWRLIPFICGPYYHQGWWHGRASPAVNLYL
ncbi:hypothetical protein VTO73DRAFT_10660 [Trametes versicolor]